MTTLTFPELTEREREILNLLAQHHLNAEIARAVKTPEQHKRYLERGIELTSSASPEEFTAYIKAEFEKKSKLARDVGIKID